MSWAAQVDLLGAACHGILPWIARASGLGHLGNCATVRLNDSNEARVCKLMAKKKYCIVDGYNVIYGCGLVRDPVQKLDAGELEQARRTLLQHIQNAFTTEDQKRTTVVFDSNKRAAREDRDQGLRMEVRYAVDHDDADELIEQLIRKHSAPKQLLVVSSDHRIQKAASRRSASFVDAEPWFDQVLELEQKRRAKPSPKLSPLAGDKQGGSQGADGTGPLAEPIYDPFPPGYAEDLLDDFHPDNDQ